MAKRKVTKKRIPDGLSLTKMIARRVAPPSGIVRDGRPVNWNHASRDWMRYQILLDLRDNRWGYADQLARHLRIGRGMCDVQLKRLCDEGAIKLVRTRAEARKRGIEHFRTVRPCWVLTHKAIKAIKAEERVMTGE